MQLEGRLALITGGGQGIGRGIVDSFLQEGARVAVIQRRPLDPQLHDHENVVGIQGDLSDPSTLSAIVDQAADRLGGLDTLVNNAGLMVERGVSELTVEEWDLMMALNLRAPMFLTQAALPHMRRRGGGSIINIGSIEGHAANPDHTAYSAAKAGLHGMTRAMAVDLGRDGIRCNAIAPGWIETELSESYLETASDTASARETLVRLHPIGRVGRPADIGNLAVFLAGGRSGFLTGETIILDGGRTARLPLPF